MRWIDRAEWPLRLPRVVDVAWGVFAVANLAAMALWPEWETVPFHFIWVSLTILYGFRVWRARPTLWALGAVVLTTGIVLYHDHAIGAQPLDELTEVPLMASMFLAMVWHARRHLAATERVRRVSEQNLRLLDREHAFLQEASHELRTPITIAMGHAELIQGTQRDPVVAEDARVVVEELQRLGRLADRLLTLASVEQPGFLRLTRVDLVPLIVELAHRWSPTPRRWRVESLDEAVVRADPDRLQLALDAIVENAVRHTGPEDSICFAMDRRAGRITISVADSGSGIAPSDLGRIFDRFSRAAASGPEARRQGSGLGLSIAKAVVEAQGGTIEAESRQGKGSTFRISLPADDDPGRNLPGQAVAPDAQESLPQRAEGAALRTPLAGGITRARRVHGPA